jgi:Flp pilus assembly protein TadD
MTRIGSTLATRSWLGLALTGALLAGCAGQPATSSIAGNTPGAASDEELAHIAADLEARGQLETALPFYQRATAAAPDTPAAQMQLGDAYLRAGKAGQAADAYRAVLKSSPENGQALLGLGSALVRTGDVDGAAAALSKAAPLLKTMASYNRLGVAQTLAGRLPEAQTSFEAASALAPDDLDVRTNHALAAALDGQEDKAVALMRGVVAAPGAQAQHRRDLVIVLGLFGRAAEARAAAPRELPAREVQALLARANAIRAMTDAKARAKALGTVMG